MAVGRHLLIDRAAQVQRLDDRGGAQIKALPHQGGKLRIRQLAGAVRLDQDGDGVGHADGVSQLDLAALSKTGRDDILGDVGLT